MATQSTGAPPVALALDATSCNPRSMALHELLEARRDAVMARWKAQVTGTLTPESMPHVELIDHLPQFLGEIATALREDLGLPTTGPVPDESVTAAGHGSQRLRLGFSLDSVVREYGALRDCIVAEARDQGLQPTFAELQVVFDCIVTGMARAVSQYTTERDAELRRQANEHFAFIAHELRNPLSSATMALTMLKTKGHLSADLRLVGALERGLKRTNELIDQTLQIARVASGIELKREMTTLRRIFEDAELGALAEAEANGVELRVVIDTDARVSLDVRLIRSAVGNLIRNAVKYTNAGSVVEIRGAVADGHAVVEVEDRCGGLDPGAVERAFAPFVRLDSKQDGFGLGLAISKQAAEAHGGHIRVQNLPGKGCIFVLDLPVA